MLELRGSAVLAGMAADLVASMVGGVLWGFVQGLRAARQGPPPEAIAAAIQGDGAPLPSLAIGLAAACLGGHVAARMARHAPLAHGAGVGVASLLVAALFVGIFGVGSSPTWYHVASFVAIVPAAMLGAATVARTPVAKPATG